MKKIIVFLVVLFFAKPIFPLLDFVINYDSIQEMCENRNKPELQCNGSCHLKKELAKTAESDTPISNNKKLHSQQLEILFLIETDWTIIIPSFAINSKVSDTYHTFYSYLNSNDLFKPPLV